jgi:hypothetical protein
MLNVVVYRHFTAHSCYGSSSLGRQAVWSVGGEFTTVLLPNEGDYALKEQLTCSSILLFYYIRIVTNSISTIS